MWTYLKLGEKLKKDSGGHNVFIRPRRRRSASPNFEEDEEGREQNRHCRRIRRESRGWMMQMTGQSRS